MLTLHRAAGFTSPAGQLSSNVRPHKHTSSSPEAPLNSPAAMSRKLIVITGSYGVGKSTLARALQERFLPAQWLHFSVDSILYCLPRSVIERVDQHNDHRLVDSKAIVAAAYAATCTFLELGHRVIFDAVILNKKGAESMMSELGRFDPLLVELTVSVQPSHLDSRRSFDEGVHLFRRWTPCRRGQGRQGAGTQMS